MGHNQHQRRDKNAEFPYCALGAQNNGKWLEGQRCTDADCFFAVVDDILSNT